MIVTQDLLKEAKLIFNHMPKTGGSSMQFFFEELFGKDRVFRVRDRTITPETKTVDRLSKEEVDFYRVFQGHFRYGNHTVVGEKSVYFGVMRDPIDRLISNYFYARRKGRADRKAHARSVSLRAYVEELIETRHVNFGAAQTRFLTGEGSSARAKQVIDRDYLICCATEQLDACQAVFARLYGRPDLAAMHRNTTGSGTKGESARRYLKDKYSSHFGIDYDMLSYVRQKFEREYAALPKTVSL